MSGGRVYVNDRQLGPNAANPANAFDRSSTPGTEGVVCFDEVTGKVLWRHEYACRYSISYPAGPRCTPVIAEGKVFSLGAEGDMLCLNASDGKVIWSCDFKKVYEAATPMWGFAAHPLLDGRKLICLAGGTGSLVVALDRDTGKEIWRALTAKEPGYCPPVIYEFGGRRQLIVWHPESVNSLDPETGSLLWSVPWSIKAGLTISTPRTLGNQLFLTAFYEGSMMLDVNTTNDGARVLWRSKKSSERDTTELHSIISTPFVEKGHIYGVCSYGQLRCLKAATGERLWETLAATTGPPEARWANAFLIKHEDRFFLFNEKGELIIARLTPQGYDEISRAFLIEPTNTAAGRKVLWSHPAFANRNLYVRNDREMICVSLAAEP